MPILWNDISRNSSGGTELICRRLEKDLKPDIMEQVQIIPSRLHDELDETKVRVLWCHDLPKDPESDRILCNQGWRRFHLIVFVSHWQQQAYINHYKIPWSKCCVIQNAVYPIERIRPRFQDGKVRFIYHTTPHRGLSILYPVFSKLAEEFGDSIHLDVYSSFKIYGWEQRDVHHADLFKALEDHPNVTSHGSVPNDEVRKALAESDVFAYPCVWPETSCMALMEAMSAGLECVHSSLAALPETGANLTSCYQFLEDNELHAAGFYHGVRQILVQILEGGPSLDYLNSRLNSQSNYANLFYNWERRVPQWESVLTSVLDSNPPRAFEAPTYSFPVMNP